MNEDRDRAGDAPAEPDQTSPAPKSAPSGAPDPADDVPVPGAMSPAEIDERAQVVEALRREQRGRTGDPPPEP
jgi:hypothetical protein